MPLGKNRNRYHHKGVVVLDIQEKNVDGKQKIYAVGYDLDKPEELVGISLMDAEAYRKHIAQFRFGLVEKQNALGEISYYNNIKKAEISKEEYYKQLYSPNIEADFTQLVSQKKNAEGLLTKKNRIASFPTVLMFDNANKLGSVGGMNVYEAKWINGIAGNSKANEANEDFVVTHRKVLGNINVKHNSDGKPYWADVKAIDRIIDLQTPNPKLSEAENSELSVKNRDILRFALSNSVETESGYKAERNPFTYMNVFSKDKQFKETISLYNEEYADKRVRPDDSIVEYSFQRSKDAPETLKAYIYKQDRLSLPLQKAIIQNDEITPKMVDDAIKGDKARAVISALMGVKFQPLITTELTNKVEDVGLKEKIAIAANVVKSLHKELATGESELRMINGTSYAVGPKYLERFVKDVMPTSNNKLKPINAVVNTEVVDNKVIIRSYNEDKTLPFSPMYISPKKWDAANDQNPSLFTSLITVAGQSHSEVFKARINHTELNESHNPSADSLRLIRLEYADYASGKEKVPNIFELFEKEAERVKELVRLNRVLNETENLHRISGIHIVKETPAPQNTNDQQVSPEMKKQQHNDAEFM